MAAEPESRVPSRVGWWATGIIVLLTLTYIAAIGASSLYDHPGGQLPPALNNSTVNQVMSNVPMYLGKTAAVNGKVAQPLSPETVTLANEGSGDNTALLVVARPNTLPQGLKPGDSIHVAGVLGTFSRPQIEKDVGVSLDPQKFAGYEGKPVLIVQSASRMQ